MQRQTLTPTESFVVCIMYIWAKYFHRNTKDVSRLPTTIYVLRLYGVNNCPDIKVAENCEDCTSVGSSVSCGK